jgi:hypothetical protein
MPAHVAPLALVALLLPLSLYRRIRRNVGRQPLAPLRLKARSGIMLAVVLALAIWLSLAGQLAAVGALAAGALAGIGISRFGLRHTTFGEDAQGPFYRPNPWIGLGLSAVLMARVGYRVVQLWPALSQPGAAPPAMAAPGPLTAALLGAVLMYYVAYGLGVLGQAGKPRAAG